MSFRQAPGARLALAVGAVLLTVGCGGGDSDYVPPESADQVQRDALEKTWAQGNEKAQAMLCRAFRKDPEGFSRDFSNIGKDSVVREFFEDKC